MADKPLSTIPAKPADAPLAQIAPSVDATIQAAIAKGVSPADLQGYLDFQRAVRDDLAKQKYNEAFVKFKTDCPPILQLTETDQYKRTTPQGTQAKGRYADITDIARVIDPVLRECGLAYRFSNTTIADGCIVTVCRLAHIGGHHEDTPSPPFPIGKPITNRAGDPVQSMQQVSAAAATYARRYALIAALGLVTLDPDDDGAGGQPTETISEDQQHTLNDLLIAAEDGEHCEGDKAQTPTRRGFLNWLQLETLSEIPAAKFDLCAKMLQRKIAKKAAIADGRKGMV